MKKYECDGCDDKGEYKASCRYFICDCPAGTRLREERDREWWQRELRKMALDNNRAVLDSLIESARKEERERCAKIVEGATSLSGLADAVRSSV